MDTETIDAIPSDVRNLLPLVRASRTCSWFEKGTLAILLDYDGPEWPLSNTALRLVNEGTYIDRNFLDPLRRRFYEYHLGDDHEFHVSLDVLEGANEFGADLLAAFREQYDEDVAEKEIS